MLAGHYGPAYLLRGRFPQVSLLALFLAVQAPDIVFFILVPLGIEHVRVDPSVRGPLGMTLVSIPYTHSLVLTLVYGALMLGLGLLRRRFQIGVALALAVMSHWLLDLIVHEPDLPLLSGDSVRLGLHLWRASAVAYALEVLLVVGPAVWLARRFPPGRPRRWIYGSALVLVLSQTNFMLAPPPATTWALAISAELAYAFFALIAWRADRAIATPG